MDTGTGEKIATPLQAETERLLAGRTRDIKLSGALLRLYQEKSWSQRSKVVRTWTIWVILLSWGVVAVSALFARETFWWAAIMVGCCIPILNFGLFLVWRRPRKVWIKGLSTFLVLIGMLVALGIVGLAPGGANSERYLTCGLFVNTVAITLIMVESIWLLAVGCFSPIVFLAFQMFSPSVSIDQAVGGAIFYGMGIIAVVASRQNATLLAHKSFLMSLRDGYRSEALKRAYRELETLATRDPLTGLANRRAAADHIGKIWSDRTVPKTGVAFAMADVDHFKNLNDTAGHAAGDECLQRVARSIEASVRAGTDMVCRHGGEEFLIILNGVTADLAWTLAERIRRNVEALDIVNPGLDLLNGAQRRVTISLGVAFAQNDAEPELVIKWADEALYDAKHCGRNQVFMPVIPTLDRLPASADVPPPGSLRDLPLQCFKIPV